MKNQNVPFLEPDWFTAQGDNLRLTQLQPPPGDNPVLPGDPPGDGELVRN